MSLETGNPLDLRAWLAEMRDLGELREVSYAHWKLELGAIRARRLLDGEKRRGVRLDRAGGAGCLEQRSCEALRSLREVVEVFPVEAEDRESQNKSRFGKEQPARRAVLGRFCDGARLDGRRAAGRGTGRPRSRGWLRYGC